MTDSVRKIIHIDADAFYAAVEMRENPKLQDKPIAVGGSPHGRGVIATCNYLARQYGIHSAMPSAHAIRRCPELVFIKPDFPLYRLVSKQMREIFARYTDLIEPLSLDEAYLDVTHCQQHSGSATLIARAIKRSVHRELGIHVSAGVAPNKFLAKVASDWDKPDGLFVITPEQVDDFVLKLPVRKINGVGKVTSKKLNDLGIETCRDIRECDEQLLIKRFGKQGKRLIELAQGLDARPVQTSRVRKSLSVEHTYNDDLQNQEAVCKNVPDLYRELTERVQKSAVQRPVSKRVVKIKFNDFTQTTLEHSLSDSGKPWDRQEQFEAMVVEAWQRGKKPVRLLGLGVRFREDPSTEKYHQLELFEANGTDESTTGYAMPNDEALQKD